MSGCHRTVKNSRPRPIEAARDRDHITPTLCHSNLFAEIAPGSLASTRPRKSGTQKFPFSRGAFRSRPRAMSKQSPKLRRQPAFVRCSGVERPDASRSQTAHKRTARTENKRKQNADRRGSPCFTFRRSAHPGQGALACRRSTLALARETVGPQGSASGHASWDSPERSVRYGRPNRGAETSRRSTGVTRAESIPVAVSTSHAGRYAGRVDARRRPSAKGTNPPPASTTPAPASYSSPASVLARGARGRRF